MLGPELSLSRLATPARPGDLLDLDFIGGRYGREGVWADALTDLAGVEATRSGPGVAARQDGRLVPFASNVARITDRGLLIEGARTNLVTVFNADPATLAGATKSGDAAATLTLADDTAPLAAAGLGDLCVSGQVWRLDNSAGAGVAHVTFDGGAASSDAHGLSVYLRATIGGGLFGFMNGSLSGFVASAGAYPATETYVRPAGEVASGALGRRLGVRVVAGAIVHLILPQVEQGPVTSPIVTSGATATRGADVATLTLDIAAGRDFTLAGEVEFTRADAVSSTIVELDDGAGDGANRMTLARAEDGTMAATLAVGGVAVTTPGLVRAGARRVRWAIARAGEAHRLVIDGVSVGAPTSAALPDLSRLFLGSRAGAGGRLNDYVRAVRVAPRALTEAEMQSLTA